MNELTKLVDALNEVVRNPAMIHLSETDQKWLWSIRSRAERRLEKAEQAQLAPWAKIEQLLKDKQ